jgi:aconitate hydratase
VERHARFLGLWRDDERLPEYSGTLTIDLGEIVPQVAGPRRPQERMPLNQAPASFRSAFPTEQPSKPDGLRDGDIVIAAISSCTHTSNAKELMAAGLLARNARRRKLQAKPWVKTSLSPGSTTVADYLQAAGLRTDLDALGFHVVGFGCMTCAGNPGQLAAPILEEIRDRQLKVCTVLSGNRNFEGRIHPDVRAAYLASPALVIAYAIAGTILTDLTTEPVGIDMDGKPVMLSEIWPDEQEIAELVERHVDAETYRRAYDRDAMAQGIWSTIDAPKGPVFPWDAASTHVRQPPFFSEAADRPKLQDIAKARPVAVLGDHITTDHISPFGQILPDSAAARYLSEHDVSARDWSSYAERRGNHEVLRRSAFANPRLRNRLAPGAAGNMTTGPAGEEMLIFDAAQAYRDKGTPTVIFAGKEYGTGSARDWAAKCTQLLGVKAVIAESFERIHRSNLVGVGVVPCQLPDGITVDSLNIGQDTEIAIEGLSGVNGPLATVRMTLKYADGKAQSVPLTCRLDTEAEVTEFRAGGMFASAERAAMALGN